MRYAVVSDLHSNRQALKAVLADIGQNNVDEIICLGDIVGYGPAPQEVLNLARENIQHFILGNHDAVVADYMSAEHFNDHARELIEWTCSSLDASAIEFFKSVPLMINGEYYRFTHGEFVNPGRFGYIIDEDEALASFNCCDDSLMLIGHSHVPGLYVIGNSGTPHWLPPTNFGLEDEKRYIVNVGSVGQPRDNDVRASYCIFDDQTKDIYFHKVPFDIRGYRDDLARNSLPATSYFLTLEPDVPFQVVDAAVIESPTDFTPLSEAETVKIKTEVKDLKKAVDELKKEKSWLIFLVFILLVAFAVFGILLLAGVFRPDSSVQGLVYKSLNTQISPDLTSLPLDKNLLFMPGPIKKVNQNTRLKEWSVVLTDSKNQEVSVIKNQAGKNKDENVFAVFSKKAEIIDIVSLPVPAKKGMSFNAKCQLKKGNFESGFVKLALQQQLSDGSWKDLLSREPKNFETKKGWTGNSPSLTLDNPLNKDGDLRIVIKIRIKGEVSIRKCFLQRTK